MAIKKGRGEATYIVDIFCYFISMMILGYSRLNSCLIREYKDFLTARGGPHRPLSGTGDRGGAPMLLTGRRRRMIGAAAGVCTAPDTVQGGKSCVAPFTRPIS